MLFYVVFALSIGALSASKLTNGTVACDPALRPVVITEPGTVITTPNYPAQYPPNQICEYYVQSTGLPDANVQLTFSDFVLEECIDCGCDKVDIYAGADDTAPLVATLCGNQGEPEYSLTAEAFIRFTSDSSTEGSGFSATVEYGGGACEPGGTYLSGPGGAFSSPNYPGLYPTGSACEWAFLLPNISYVVQLTFVDFNLEVGCSGGTGTVWDDVQFQGCTEGVCETYGLWHGTYGTDMAGTTFSSYAGADRVSVLFNSDTSIGALGFNATYAFVMP